MNQPYPLGVYGVLVQFPHFLIPLQVLVSFEGGSFDAFGDEGKGT
ncbi:Mobile element protein [Microcystis aeruginosa]